MIDQHVPHDADVVHAAVGFDGVVVTVADEVVVKIDRDRPPVPVFRRRIFRTVQDAGAAGNRAVGLP